MSIKLYTTHCPVCTGIEMQLKQKKISYIEVTDVNEMTQKGYTHPPVLEVDGVPYKGGEIMAFIKRGKLK